MWFVLLVVYLYCVIAGFVGCLMLLVGVLLLCGCGACYDFVSVICWRWICYYVNGAVGCVFVCLI